MMTLTEIKLSTENFLTKNNVPVNKNLPFIEELNEVNPLNSKTVAKKLCSFSYLIGLGYNAPPNEIRSLLDQYDLVNELSEYEQSLIHSDELSEQDKINCTWLDEAAQALAWALNLVELNNFTHCDDDLAEKVPFKSNPSKFIDNAILKPIEEIQAMADQLYRLHWYAKQCHLEGKECFYSESIIRERRKAIDWVYGVEKDWDEVPSDT